MASPQWRRGQRSEGHASAKRVRFDLPRVHGQWPGTIRGAEPTAGSSFVVGNYITDKTTLTRLRLHQTHPANDSTPQAAQNLQPNTSFMLRGGSAETMRVLSDRVSWVSPLAIRLRRSSLPSEPSTFPIVILQLRGNRSRRLATGWVLSPSSFGSLESGAGRALRRCPAPRLDILRMQIFILLNSCENSEKSNQVVTFPVKKVTSRWWTVAASPASLPPVRIAWRTATVSARRRHAYKGEEFSGHRPRPEHRLASGRPVPEAPRCGLPPLRDRTRRRVPPRAARSHRPIRAQPWHAAHSGLL